MGRPAAGVVSGAAGVVRSADHVRQARRGTLRSGSDETLPTLEHWMDDASAVLDAAGSQKAAVIANLGGGLLGTSFAAAHPERVASLVLVDCWARYLKAPTIIHSAARARSSTRTSTRPSRVQVTAS